MGEQQLADGVAGDRLRGARRREGLTQADLASRLGVSRGSVNRWEGGAMPSLGPMRTLSQVLRVSLDDLRRWWPETEATNVVPFMAGGRLHSDRRPEQSLPKTDPRESFLEAVLKGLAEGHAASPEWNSTAAKVANIIGVEWKHPRV